MSRDLLALALLSALTFFVGLGRPAIADSDEAFYAEAAREMVESGDWITPRYNYEFRFQKPILFYWLVAATYFVAGVSEAAARFPSAVAGLGLVLVTYAAGSRRYGRGTGLMAGAIVSTSFGYFFMARQSLPDLPLACFVTIAVWAAVTALDASDPAARRRWIVMAGMATAAAFLTKGPVGLAVPVIILLPIVLRERLQSDGTRPWLGFRPSEIALAAAVVIAIAAPWYVAMTTRHGFWYLQHFFIGENVERFATDRFNEPRPLWFYLPILMGGMLPWSPLLLLALPAALRVVRRQRRLTPPEWRLLIWAAAPMIFFSISIGKQPRYILPVLPPLAILVAVVTRRYTLERLPAGPAGRVILGLGGLTLAALAQSLYRAAPLLEAIGSSAILPSALLIGTAGTLAMVLPLVRPRWAPASLAAATAVSLAALHYTAMSTSGPEPVERVADLVRATARTGDQPATHRVFVRNLIFYTRMKHVDLPTLDSVAAHVPSDEASLLVIGATELQRLESEGAPRARRLGEVAYFNVANARVRTVFDPDPARDVEKVLLVSTR